MRVSSLRAKRKNVFVIIVVLLRIINYTNDGVCVPFNKTYYAEYRARISDSKWEKIIVKDAIEKYLSRVCDIVCKILIAKRDGKKKRVRRLKGGCFLHSLRWHFLLFFFWHREPTVSQRHENCSAKIRYNHCRRAWSETDSFRTNRECTAGNPSSVLLFSCFHFEDILSYHPGKVCAWLLSGVHSLREVSTLMLRVISLTLVDAVRWSSKSISVKETAENYVVYRACNLYFVS